MGLKQKTIHGFKWSFINITAGYGFRFFTTMLLARLLEPTDFGIAGMATIFIALSSVFVDGGMGDSLIRKKNSNSKDYNSVFFLNLIISIVFYVILFFMSFWIADFFKEKRLVLVIQVASIGLIIHSLSMVQIAILRKELDFKRQAIISFISAFVGALFSVGMAYLGYSYWSLVIPSLISGALTTILLTFTSSWRPRLYFRLGIIKDHFKFGSKIMAGSFLTVVYQRMYYAFIGKYFTMVDLGYYFKADNLQKLPSSSLDTIVRHVTYPVLATMQDEPDQLKRSYQTLIKYTTLANGLLMFLMAALGEQIVLVLFGEKWLPSVPYFQLLSVVGVFMPINSINTNIVNVKGRSDVFLYLTFLKIFLNIPVLFVGLYYGIQSMIVAMNTAMIIQYIIIVFITKRFINYPVLEQLTDVCKILLFSLIVISGVYVAENLINFKPFVELIILIPLSFVLLIAIGRLTGLDEYMQIEKVILNKLKFIKFKNNGL
jgi:teichuronic acid exporter